MPDPLPLPLRVLVKGPSTPIWSSWMGGPPTDLALPRALEAALLRAGRPVEVRCAARMGQPTKDLVLGFEEEVVQWSPDVVVVSAGQIEAIHLLLPRWFERWANRVDRRSGPWRRFYRRKVARSVWKLCGLAQARLDRTLPTAVRHLRSDRALRQLEGYLDLVRMVASPKVYLLELLPPAGHMNDWFPGMAERVDHLNARMRDITRRSAGSVDLVEVQAVARATAGDDPRAATPDGIHYTPALHAAVAEVLAVDVERWASGQPHLRPVGPA